MAVQPSKQLYSCLDSSAEGGFISFFKSLPEKPDTTVRIFDRSDYYTVHGEDALLAAKDLYHTNSVIKYLGSGANKVPSVVLSRPNFESFARDLLLVKQYRVEIYQNKAKKNNVWEVAYRASPGNLQQLEGVLFGHTDAVTSTCVMAVKLTNENGQRMVGVAYAEASLRKLGVSEFLENDQFSNIEMMLVQLNPKECLVVANDNSGEASKLRNALKRSSVLLTERKRAEFSAKDITQDLNRLLKLDTGMTSSALPEIDLKHSMASLAALIKYLELLSDETNFGSYHLTTLDLSQYMRLDSAAVRALNLDPQSGETRSMNLLGLLNKCSTAQGQRLLSQWVKQPLLDQRLIEERLDVVEVFVSEVQLRQSLQEEQLKRFPDLFRLSRKLQRAKGTLQDCVRIYQSVRQLPHLVATLRDYTGPHQPLITANFTAPLQELKKDFANFLELVETTIDLDMVEHHEFVIKPSFDEGLAQLRSEMDESESKATKVLRKVAGELDLEMHKAVKLASNEQLGYFLRITKKHEKEIRGQKRFTVLETRNDGVKFTTSYLQAISDEYRSLKEQYSSAQASVAEEVLGIAAGYAEPMQTFSDVVAQLDVLVSFAVVSMTAPVPYTRPTITPKGEGDIILVGSRHPCLEMQDEVAFIANDVSLVRGKDMFQIITGPNMGGKSTYIRQIGVIVLMAQIGCFVPCQKATVSIVDCILARVGASDSQVKGVSTFMAEMLETAAILRSATKDSLVIIDELGRGTSTYDGFGLAWAISEHIATKINCFCLFATHFHELTELANEVTTVTNRHVTAQMSDETLTLLYHVKPGVCDQSFGIHVAELVHFPNTVIDFAKQKAAELEIFHCYGDNGVDGEPAAKRKKTEAEEGEKIISEFLSRAQELFDGQKRGEVSSEELQQQMEEMKKEVLESDNSYIQNILASAIQKE